MKTTPSTTTPLPPAALRLSEAKANSYFDTLRDALDDEGLLGVKTGKRGEAWLNAQDADAILKLPEVKRDLGRFVREAFLGESGIVFNYDEKGLAKLAEALGRAEDHETFEVFLAEILGMASDPNVQVDLRYDLASAFGRGYFAKAPASDFTAADAGVTGGTVAWKPTANEQWDPAMARASEYAQSLGFDGLTAQGTGVMARSMGPAPVNSIEYQKVILFKGAERFDLGNVLPESGHLTSLKSEAALTGELIKLIDQHVQSTKNAAAAAKADDGGKVSWL